METNNSTLIIIAAIAAFPPTLVAFFSLLQNKKNTKAINEVHLSLNSRLDALIKSEKSVSKTEGLVEGRSEPRLK